eukprot:6121428-Amphidinium_carterae.1
MTITTTLSVSTPTYTRDTTVHTEIRERDNKHDDKDKVDMIFDHSVHHPSDLPQVLQTDYYDLITDELYDFSKQQRPECKVSDLNSLRSQGQGLQEPRTRKDDTTSEGSYQQTTFICRIYDMRRCSTISHTSYRSDDYELLPECSTDSYHSR